jgi:hypothetical protein
VARAALAQIAPGTRPAVPRFHDDDAPDKYWVDLLTAPDVPDDGLTTYSTVSLHTAPNVLDGRDIRVEFAAVALSEVPQFANVIVSAALSVIKDGWLAGPDFVYPDLLEPQVSETLRHLWLTTPFPFEELTEVPITDELAVRWLFLVPISEAERQFALENGTDALGTLFEEHEVPYFDLRRPSFV